MHYDDIVVGAGSSGWWSPLGWARPRGPA